jgi:hypothetical protein
MRELKGSRAVPEEGASLRAVERAEAALTRRTLLQAGGALAVIAATGSGAQQQAMGAEAALPQGTYPYAFRTIEPAWIPLPDGIKLFARIWLPLTAGKQPVPAILNYNPYDARHQTRVEDDTRYPYYAGHGYACVRVNIRGSGNSDGYPMDEYVQQEQDDGLEVIKWIASYFPLVMPSPEPVTLTVYTGASSLELPVRPSWEGDSRVNFTSPFVPPVRVRTLKKGSGKRTAEYEVATRQMTTRYYAGGDVQLLEATGTELSGDIQTAFTIDDRDPAGTVVDHRCMSALKRGDWAPRSEGRVKFTATKTHYLLHGELTAYDGEEKIFARVWHERIPRKLA